ncbi:hypothetical protein Z949_4122 [Sulfitobacter guttiformis KCTC 32187]|nr:hypothetical protein Z949_4122 [Sulfitobacter guttiformis KCTC 32187]
MCNLENKIRLDRFKEDGREIRAGDAEAKLNAKLGKLMK